MDARTMRGLSEIARRERRDDSELARMWLELLVEAGERPFAELEAAVRALGRPRLTPRPRRA
jgi:hypothetical protein